MRQERLYVFVGLFVGGAISLSILIGLYIYDEYLHEKVETYVMFFKGSLSGIQVSSDVTYRGVKIGEVKLIEITESTDENQNEILIPVYVQFFVERKFVGKQNPIQLLVKRNFVATIKQPNFLTGIASIELVKESGSRDIALTTYNSYPVFPTSNKEELYTSLDDAFASAKKAFEDVSDFIQSARVNAVLDTTKTMALNVDKMVRNFNQLIPTTLNTFSQSMKQFSELSRNLDELVPTSLTTFNKSMKQFSSLSRDLDKLLPPTLTSVSQSIKEVSEAANSTQANFSRSMRQFSDAANSTQNLMDYLSRYPESILRGKK
ncbi:MAG: MCE family protein [Tatlockia sp.]|nr:MCE family protein [Tatlockia sp.]